MLLLFSCTKADPEQRTDDTGNTDNEILSFIETEQYQYSESKGDLPDTVISYISKINSEPFKIGDSTDAGNINLSDSQLLSSEDNDKYEYTNKLQFALIGDNTCLVVYTKGGIGTRDVVDFLQYKDGYRHVRYTTLRALIDTVALRSFLQTNPDPEQKSF